MRKTICSTLLAVGLISFGFGTYVSSQVAAGQQQLAASGGQQRRVPLVGPIRKEANMQANQSMQRNRFQQLQGLTSSAVSANWFRGVGIILFMAGLGGLLFVHKKK